MTALAALFGLSIPTSGLAQQPQHPSSLASQKPDDVRVVERGPNHRVDEFAVSATDENGRIATTTGRYVALEGGMHYLHDGKWLPTRVNLQEYDEGFTAFEGQHKVILSRSLRVRGAVDMQTADGVRMRATPLQIVYRDRISGKVAVLGEVKETLGVKTGKGVVLWPDAFSGIRADYRATYHAASFECDVILREAPPAPESLGLDPKFTDLQVITEFYETAATATRMAVSESDQDTHLQLGEMHFGRGSAFGEDMANGSSATVSVRKEWTEMEGRRVLIESVSLTDSAEAAAELPREGAWLQRPALKSGYGLPPEVVAAKRSSGTWEQAASRVSASGRRDTKELALLRKPGLVIDYVVVTTVTNFTFSSTNTYYVSGPVTLNGTVTFEPSTVIKYAATNSPSIEVDYVSTTLNWLGEPYHPVFMTARDDNSVGQTLPGSTGSPSGTYAETALVFDRFTQTGINIRDLRIAFARLGIKVHYGSTKSLIRHAQFVRCNAGISASSATLELQNVLMDRVKTNFYLLNYSPVEVYFATFDAGDKVNHLPTSSTVNLHAVLCTAVTDTSNVNFTGTMQPSSSNVGFYETSAAGNHYFTRTTPAIIATNLWSGSIPEDLFEEWTAQWGFAIYPPPILSGTLTASTNFNSKAEAEGFEEAQAPCGYRYYRLDLIVSNIVVGPGKSLTIESDCNRIGLFGNQAFISQGGSVVIEGGPNRKGRIVRVASVQENPVAATITNASFQFLAGTNRAIKIRFVDIAFVPSEDVGRRSFHAETQWNGETSVRDCRFNDVSLRRTYTYNTGPQSLVLQNNIFQNCDIVLDHDSSGGTFNLQFRNNLVLGGRTDLLYAQATHGAWNVSDSLFSSTYLYYDELYGDPLPSSHNAFFQTTATLPGSGNVSITSLNWTAGPFGPYYYPSSGSSGSLSDLINSGSRTAASAGLAQHTCLTNISSVTHTDESGSISTEFRQSKDSGTVDIGFHYAAASRFASDWYPSNSDRANKDSDALPDYLEDADGNSAQNGTETNWQSWDSDNDGLSDSFEKMDTTDPLDSDTDNDGSSDLEEYWAGTNPLAGGDTPTQLLDHWSFDSGANSDNGAVPTSNTSTAAQSYDGYAACFTNSSAKITIPASTTVSGTNRATLSFWNGTVRLNYVSDWGVNGTSAAPNQWIRLLECGDWKLSINPAGSHLVFQSPTTAGGSMTNLTAMIPWDSPSAARKQCEITLTYSPGYSQLVIKSGHSLSPTTAVGPGVQADVSAGIKASGWTLGNASSGGYPALGCIDELETFPVQADPDTPSRSNVRFARFYEPRRRQANTLNASDVTNGIRLQWVRGWEGDWATNASMYGISRRTVGAASFSSQVTGVRTNVWVDTNVSAGVYYEYRIDRHPSVPVRDHPVIVASRSGASIDQRGRAILMIDQTLTNELWNDFEAYKRQLAADGWTVTNYYVPRHFDQPVGADCATYHGNTVAGWRANTNNMATIKGHIRREYTNNPTATNVVILIGHVPIPYSGLGAEDGHGCGPGAGDHGGAWTSDSWYGDMTGTWTDSASYNNCSFCINDNVANDGKFDNNTIPTESGGTPGRLEMPLGRIDFANLPEFGDGVIFPGATNSAQAEVKLFQRYFDKTLRFRRNGIGFLRQSKTFQGDGAFHEMIGGHQWINSRAFGSENFETDSKGTDLFLATTNYLWGSHGDYGFFTTMGNGQYPMDRRHYSSEIASGSEAPRGMFMLLDGSYMADWNSVPDDLMRVCLGMPDSVLTVLWGRNHRWRTERVHAGAGIHTMLEDTLSSGMTASSRRSLLGDPTLRERYITPVSVFTATKSGSNAILSWSTNADADAGYRIYRATATNALSWALVGTAASGATSWTNAPSSPSSNAYMIKAAGIRTSGSGSTTILGHGVIATNVVVIP